MSSPNRQTLVIPVNGTGSYYLSCNEADTVGLQVRRALGATTLNRVEIYGSNYGSQDVAGAPTNNPILTGSVYSSYWASTSSIGPVWAASGTAGSAMLTLTDFSGKYLRADFYSNTGGSLDVTGHRKGS